LRYFNLPSSPARSSFRIETGVEQDDEISSFYDPMIAKLVVHRSCRNEALRALASNCGTVQCWPVKTNAAFLNRLLSDEDVCHARLTTGLIAAKADALVPSEEADAVMVETAARAMVLDSRTAVEPFGWSLPDDDALLLGPWDKPTGFRLNRDPAPVRVALNDGTHEYLAAADRQSDHAWFERVPDGVLVALGGDTRVFNPTRTDGFGHHSAASGAILSPMPGKIIAVEVTEGQQVTKGQKLLTLEAMKMEHTLTAPFDGIVAELAAAAGAQVQVEALLARIEAAAD
jgi:3-methylcrotonyl-CoA carboxylase alpha subunit